MKHTNEEAMGKASRDKGARGERMLASELKDLLGLDVRRRVRNHAGESDLTGMPGWSVECKNCAAPSLATWWKQTVSQAQHGEIPVLFYKLPRKPFRAVVPASLFLGGEVEKNEADTDYTLEMSLPCFAALYREREAIDLSLEQKLRDRYLMRGGRMQ